MKHEVQNQYTDQYFYLLFCMSVKLDLTSQVKNVV
jgi:hypothetical protein